MKTIKEVGKRTGSKKGKIKKSVALVPLGNGEREGEREREREREM